jgi:hypothetical protein
MRKKWMTMGWVGLLGLREGPGGRAPYQTQSARVKGIGRTATQESSGVPRDSSRSPVTTSPLSLPPGLLRGALPLRGPCLKVEMGPTSWTLQ